MQFRSRAMVRYARASAATESARRLRRDATEGEPKLWTLLRGRRLYGLKFRRQASIGPYIVDFVCQSKRLIVEADGSQHTENARDAIRDEWLADRGYVVVRFWN